MSSLTAMLLCFRPFLLTALALMSMFANAQVELRPIDEAVSRPDFLAFRNELKAVVERRDSAELLAVVHREIKTSFGGDDGVAEFKDVWKIESKESKIWDELRTVLALGGSFDEDGAFIAPYVFSRWPKSVDGFEYVAVIGSKVRIRATPNSTAPIVDTVSHSLLKSTGPVAESTTWVPVSLPDGKAGFVDRRYIRSPIDYRAIFKRIDGRWQMTMFIAGD